MYLHIAAGGPPSRSRWKDVPDHANIRVKGA